MLVKLEAYHDGAHWCDRGIGAAVFTQGDTLDQLMANIKGAVSLHYEDELPNSRPLQVLVLTEVQIDSGIESPAG